MRFSVPQFIEVEDKLVGPLTLKQSVYVVGSVGITAGIFIKFGLFFAVVLGGPILLLAFLLAFVKIHGRPFINVLYAATYYAIKNKLYLWKKTPNKKMKQNNSQNTTNTINRPVSVGISQSKLKQLAWSLDTSNQFDKNKKDK